MLRNCLYLLHFILRQLVLLYNVYDMATTIVHFVNGFLLLSDWWLVITEISKHGCDWISERGKWTVCFGWLHKVSSRLANLQVAGGARSRSLGDST